VSNSGPSGKPLTEPGQLNVRRLWGGWGEAGLPGPAAGGRGARRICYCRGSGAVARLTSINSSPATSHRARDWNLLRAVRGRAVHAGAMESAKAAGERGMRRQLSVRPWPTANMRPMTWSTRPMTASTRPMIANARPMTVITRPMSGSTRRTSGSAGPMSGKGRLTAGDRADRAAAADR
jgi:hypothetical protein